MSFVDKRRPPYLHTCATQCKPFAPRNAIRTLLTRGLLCDLHSARSGSVKLGKTIRATLCSCIPCRKLLPPMLRFVQGATQHVGITKKCDSRSAFAHSRQWWKQLSASSQRSCGHTSRSKCMIELEKSLPACTSSPSACFSDRRRFSTREKGSWGPNEFGTTGLVFASGAEAAHWASWADYTPSVKRRHPDVAKALVAHVVQKCENSLHRSESLLNRHQSWVHPQN